MKLSPAQFAKFNESGLHKNFRLQDTFKLTNMVLFDHNGILRRYKTPEEICEEFFLVRLKLYVQRKDYMVGTLHSQCLKLDNVARFIKEKIENVIAVENKKISAVMEMLIERKYDRDPEKVWREEMKKKFAIDIVSNGTEADASQATDLQQKPDDEEDDEDSDDESKKKSSAAAAAAAANKIDTSYYDYLINMSLRNLTKERRNDLLKEQAEKHEKLEALQKKSPEDLYEDDLEHFESEYHKVIHRDVSERCLIFRLRRWKKSVSMKCPRSPITRRRKLLLVPRSARKQRPNPNGQKRDPLLTVNALFR